MGSLLLKSWVTVVCDVIAGRWDRWAHTFLPCCTMGTEPHPPGGQGLGLSSSLQGTCLGGQQNQVRAVLIGPPHPINHTCIYVVLRSNGDQMWLAGAGLRWNAERHAGVLYGCSGSAVSSKP